MHITGALCLLIAIPVTVCITFDVGGGLVACLAYSSAFMLLNKWNSKALFYFPDYWAQAALARANYPVALQRIVRLETKFGRNAGILFPRGTIFLFAGQFGEAELTLRQGLEQAQCDNRCLPGLLTNLGYVLLYQGRYAEANRAFQGAFKLNQKSLQALKGLAEIYLFQNNNPKKALDLLDKLLQKASTGRRSNITEYGPVLADKAWALALLGYKSEAAALLKEAFQVNGKSFKPGLAGLHYRAGLIFTQIRQRGAENEYKFAIRLDPEGTFGQMARQALSGLGQPS